MLSTFQRALNPFWLLDNSHFAPRPLLRSEKLKISFDSLFWNSALSSLQVMQRIMWSVTLINLKRMRREISCSCLKNTYITVNLDLSCRISSCGAITNVKIPFRGKRRYVRIPSHANSSHFSNNLITLS